MMPQSMAYATLAGLPSQYGLYSSFMGSFAYVIFGTIKQVSIGPTSLMSLLTYEYTNGLTVQHVILLCFLSGCVELLMGVFKLGFLVDFISLPVVSGFQSATSVIIVVSQIKGLLGVKFKSHGFVDNIKQLVENFSQTNAHDATLGLFCIVFLLGFRQLAHLNLDRTRKKLKKFLWYVSITRNILIVIITASVAYFCEHQWQTRPFTILGKVDEGLPEFKFPQLQFENDEGIFQSFMDACKALGSGIIVVPTVAVLANVAIAKSYSSGKLVDATQEMITLGICNILGSCVQSLPTCGAFTRSAVSDASGIRTPLAGLYSGTLIVFALTFLTPYFYFIPRATLSAILICAVIFLVDYDILTPLWRASKVDFSTAIITFAGSLLFGVEIGLLIGVIINLVYLLKLWARPEIICEARQTSLGQKYIEITPKVGLFYPAIDFVRNKITRISLQGENSVQALPIIIDCKYIFRTDYTAALGIQAISEDFHARNQTLIFINLNSTIKSALDLDKKSQIQYLSTDEKLNFHLNDSLSGKEETQAVKVGTEEKLCAIGRTRERQPSLTNAMLLPLVQKSDRDGIIHSVLTDADDLGNGNGLSKRILKLPTQSLTDVITSKMVVASVQLGDILTSGNFGSQTNLDKMASLPEDVEEITPLKVETEKNDNFVNK